MVDYGCRRYSLRLYIHIYIRTHISTTITILRRNGPQFFWHFIIYIYIYTYRAQHRIYWFYLCLYILYMSIYANTISYNTRKNGNSIPRAAHRVRIYNIHQNAAMPHNNGLYVCCLMRGKVRRW